MIEIIEEHPSKHINNKQYFKIAKLSTKIDFKYFSKFCYAKNRRYIKLPIIKPIIAIDDEFECFIKIIIIFKLKFK